MVRHLRRLLKRPAVLEVGRYARRPKRMVPYLGRDLGLPARAAKSSRSCNGLQSSAHGLAIIEGSGSR